MGSRRWDDNSLRDLLLLSKTQFAEKYGISEGYVSTLKYRKKKELSEMEGQPRSEHIEREIVDADGNRYLVSEIKGWWEVALNTLDGVKVVKLNRHTTKTRPLPSESEQWLPSAPANITPSRARPKKRGHQVLFVFSDLQVDYRRLPSGELSPIHDEKAMRVARLICKDVQPDEIINLGDTVDLASLSRFDPDSDHFYRTLAPSFQRVHDYYAELRADNPNAKITEVDSNHNARLGKFVLKYAQHFWGLKQASAPDSDYPVMSYPYLANLKHVGVDFVSGYESEYIYGRDYPTPPIVFKHGKIVRSGASTASAEAKANPETHLVRGHGHRLEMHNRTNRNGDYLTYLQIGALCRIDGAVPSYHSSVDARGEVNHKQEDWQQSVLVIRDHNGLYEFDNIFIRNGVGYYQGKEYKA